MEVVNEMSLKMLNAHYDHDANLQEHFIIIYKNSWVSYIEKYVSSMMLVQTMLPFHDIQYLIFQLPIT